MINIRPGRCIEMEFDGYIMYVIIAHKTAIVYESKIKTGQHSLFLWVVLRVLLVFFLCAANSSFFFFAFTSF